MAEGQGSFTPILAEGEGGEPGSTPSQSDPLVVEKRVSKRGLVFVERDGPDATKGWAKAAAGVPIGNRG